MKLHGMLQDGEVVVSRENQTNFSEHKYEYSEAHGDEPQTARCYLECEEGKEFSITFHKPPQWMGEHIRWRIYIDGRKAQSGVMTHLHWRFKSEEMDSVDESGCAVFQRLKFDKLSVTEDEADACTDQTVLKNLGTIVLEFTEGRSQPSDILKPTSAVTAIGAIHEKAKKGLIGSSITGGSTRPFVARPCCYWQSLREPDQVEYRVIISYRTKEMLQAIRVIDLPPPPKQLAPKRGREQTGSAGLAERDQNAEGSISKRQKGAGGAAQAAVATLDVKPKIKVSPPQRSPPLAAGTSKSRPIDLTLD